MLREAEAGFIEEGANCFGIRFNSERTLRGGPEGHGETLIEVFSVSRTKQGGTK